MDDARAYLKPGCLVLSLDRMTEPVGQPGRLEPGENSRSAGQSSPLQYCPRELPVETGDSRRSLTVFVFLVVTLSKEAC